MLLIGAVLTGVVVLAGGAALILSSRKSSPTVPPVTSNAAPSRPAAPPLAPSPLPARTDAAEDEAQILYEAAERFEREKADRLDLCIARFHEVCVRHPKSSWAGKAEERILDLEKRLSEYLRREFEGARREAADLAKSGRPGRAIESLRAYMARAGSEVLKNRAEEEIRRIEDEARKRYNDAAVRAAELAREGRLDEAEKLLRGVSGESIEEVRKAAEKHLKAIVDHRAARTAHESRLALEALHDQMRVRAREWVGRLRAREYSAVLRALDETLQNPGLQPIREAIERERTVVLAAETFWNEFLKGLRSRLNRDVRLPLAEAGTIQGTLKKVQDDRCTVRVGETEREILFAKLHPDIFLLMAVGPGRLPEGDGESYARAAMWYFLEGNDDFVRLELATAKEMGYVVDALETAWREGYFRHALSAR